VPRGDRRGAPDGGGHRRLRAGWLQLRAQRVVARGRRHPPPTAPTPQDGEKEDRKPCLAPSPHEGPAARFFLGPSRHGALFFLVSVRGHRAAVDHGAAAHLVSRPDAVALPCGRCQSGRWRSRRCRLRLWSNPPPRSLWVAGTPPPGTSFSTSTSATYRSGGTGHRAHEDDQEEARTLPTTGLEEGCAAEAGQSVGNGNAHDALRAVAVSPARAMARS